MREFVYVSGDTFSLFLSIFYISQRLTLWYFVFLYLIFLSQQVLYFLLSTLVLTLYIDVVLSLSIIIIHGRLPRKSLMTEASCYDSMTDTTIISVNALPVLPNLQLNGGQPSVLQLMPQSLHSSRIYIMMHGKVLSRVWMTNFIEMQLRYSMYAALKSVRLGGYLSVNCVIIGSCKGMSVIQQ